MALGAPETAYACRTSGGLDHLAATQAAGADTNPLRGAADERPHRLEVRLEPPRSYVMRMRNCSTDHRPLAADFAPLCH